MGFVSAVYNVAETRMVSEAHALLLGHAMTLSRSSAHVVALWMVLL